MKDSRVTTITDSYSAVEPAVSLQTVVRRMRGGAQTNLVQCDNGRSYVLKMNGNPQGPNVLANEFMGAYLLQGLGILSPRTVNITVRAEQCCHLAFELQSGEELPLPGLHFGSEFLEAPGFLTREQLRGSCESAVANISHFAGVFVFDVWVNHQDQRQCVYRQSSTPNAIHAFFIDNGHLFGGPRWNLEAEQCRRLPLQPLFANAEANASLSFWVSKIRYSGPTLVERAISLTPSRWHTGNITSLQSLLVERLEHLNTLVHTERAKLQHPD